MGIYQEVIDGVNRLMAAQDLTQTKLEKLVGMPQSTVSRWLLNQSSPRFDTVSKVLDFVGVKLVWPDNPRKIEVGVQVRALPSVHKAVTLPAVEHGWRAVPVVTWGTLSGPGIVVDNRQVLNWHLVPDTWPGVLGRGNVLAAVVGPDRTGMAPSVRPGDLIFVDMEFPATPNPDSIYILRTPTGDPRLCRVTAKPYGNDTLIVVSEDGQSSVADIYSLARDYKADDFNAVIIGEVVGLFR